MQQLKRNLLSVALASATMMLAAAAQAQSNEQATQQADQAAAPQDQAKKRTGEEKKTQTLDVVTVTGIRTGIENAIATKKESTSIVESVSAEDIGKLPDVSIAESIARLPGVTAQRVAGRAQVISVRGLSPDFSTSLLNGRELVSTGDNRSVEFDQYPSELMSGVTVYKTPDAGLVGQGLSGTLDMHTVRPLDFDKPVFAVGARLQRNSLGSAANADDDGHRINASYIDQFAGGTLGIAIGFSHSDTPIQENQVGLYEPWQAIGEGWRPGVPAGTYYSDGIKALRRTGYVRRNGAMATVEFRPINEWTSTLDIFHSQAVQEDTANQFEVHLGGYNGGYSPGLNLTNVQVRNGTFVGGTASGVYPLVRGMYNKREDEINAVGWNNEITLGQTRLTADMSWSKAHRDEVNLENNTQLLPAPQLDSINLHLTGKGFSQLDPGRDYSNPNALFLSNTIYGSGYGKTPKVVDELKSFKLNANFAAPEMLGFLADFDVGANFSDREKTKHQPEGNINLGPQGITTVGSDLQYGLVDLGFAGVGFIPSWNVPGAVARYMTFAPNEQASYLVSKAWTVDEQITTGWIKANIDTQWGDVPVRGNVGVQVQRTDQSSRANYWDATRPAGQNVRPFENGKTYTDVLPSLNLAFSFDHDQAVRFAAARQIARARIDQMRASLEFGVNTATGEPGASGGNPELDPWRANAFDISYEKYFNGTKGYVAAAAFYKDLRSYIYNQTRDGYDFSSFVADYVPPVGSPPALTTGRFTAPYNGQGGNMQGLELTASLPLELLWAPLEGFGIIASASFTDSSITIPPDSSQVSSVGSSNIKLPGLSDEVYNLTAYYTHGGFEARVSNRRRSDFIGEIGNFAGERQLRYVVGEDVTDAQVSYSFDGALKGVSLLLQAYNLTNSTYQTYSQSKDRPLENVEWGRTYLVGVSYKF
jgi:TonB-dependent receptor